MYGGCNQSQEATPGPGALPGGSAPAGSGGADLAAALAAAAGDGSTDAAGFSEASVAFLRALPERKLDVAWHELNRRHYQDHLHGPMLSLLTRVRGQYLQTLSPEVAGAKRQLSSLKKNGYGKGAYHDACWFAFYDPALPSKARSPQLYFRVDGARDTWEYGFSIGPGCDAHVQRLRTAVRDAPDAVSDYLKTAPDGTLVARETKDHCRQWTAAEWCGLLRCDAAMALGSGLQLTALSIRKCRPLSELPVADRAAALSDEVGAMLSWAWPFFEACRTGAWPAELQQGVAEAARRAEGAVDVDEQAPRTLEELSDHTSAPAALLRDMEDALLGQHQIVLTGPPGTSKTFIARQFARYFARQRPGQPQGVTHTLYMHAGWSYEDFFEGLRPVDQGGRLVFENRPGVLLQWLGTALQYQHPAARHVLVLDELNRCDTAAVLGELLQLLEYRGVTVPLLSGRPFVFPPNLYLIGTMNGADRSVGRIDLALRRRFFWINLHPQPEVLARWLARPGNNPAGFDAAALRRVNDLLADRGVPPEQQVGHALFMGAGGGAADEEGPAGGPAADCPLTDKRLRQVVQFSVLPYVRELLRDMLLGSPGHGNDDLLARVESILLGGPGRRKSA